MLERCCLRLSACVSFARAAEDLTLMTGMTVSHKTQHRLQQRQDFAAPSVPEPAEQASIDGGNVRLVAAPGEASQWRQDKAVHLAPQDVRMAYFDDNEGLIAWLNAQPMATPLTCLGDGHDGIWNVFARLSDERERREILDWFHLMENLEKVGGSLQRLAEARSLLWHGQIDQTIALFDSCQQHQAQCFCACLRKHRARIVHYAYLQAEGVCSIGSGAVESTVKQIDQRLQISGARWKPQNVPTALAHRCAYLNGLL